MYSSSCLADQRRPGQEPRWQGSCSFLHLLILQVSSGYLQGLMLFVQHCSIPAQRPSSEQSCDARDPPASWWLLCPAASWFALPVCAVHLRVYCRGAFMQVKQLLEQQHTGMEVVGSMYPVPPLKQGLARVVGLGQMGAFAVVLFGDNIFEMLGYAALPQLYVQHVQQNRFGAGVAAWFVGNLLQSQLMSTGAFEVYYDGTLVGASSSCSCAC